jgi:hypothetical protein
MAGLSGPVLRDPPPQLNGVLPLPGKRDEGDVKAATLGNLVPPGVSTVLVAVPLPPVPNDCSNGFGSRLSWLGKYSPSPGFGGGARGRAGSLATPSALVAVAFLSLPALPLALSLRVLLSGRVTGHSQQATRLATTMTAVRLREGGDETGNRKVASLGLRRQGDQQGMRTITDEAEELT